MVVNPLRSLVQKGCFSIATADPFVLKTCMKYAQAHGHYFMCEATVNQVNQFGGYTGMKPADYARLIISIADETNMPLEKIILCGDHLGPFVWQNLPAETAMEYSKELVYEYVSAGFRKIHLDPTMPLFDDDLSSFGTKLIAKRAAALAAVSEEAYEQTKNDTPWKYRPNYIIGSEVPVPGGTESEETIHVTKPADLTDTIQCFKKAFLDAGLPQVFENTVAVVAQTGVEFSDEAIHDYDHEAAIPLSEELKKYPLLRFESHSTDYQTAKCLSQLIQDGVGILKVGPELTFAMREGLFALSEIEKKLAPVYSFAPSSFEATLERVMLTSQPNYWVKYYHGAPEEQKLKRQFSFSDRSRYYFSQPEVQASINKLLSNLDSINIPLTVLSQYLPVQYEKVRNGVLENAASSLLEDKIQDVSERFYKALSDN